MTKLTDLPLEIIYLILNQYQYLITISFHENIYNNNKEYNENVRLQIKNNVGKLIQPLYYSKYDNLYNVILTCKTFYNYWFKELLKIRVDYNLYNMRYTIAINNKILKKFDWVNDNFQSITSFKRIFRERFYYINSIYSNWYIKHIYRRITLINSRYFIIPKRLYDGGYNNYKYMIDLYNISPPNNKYQIKKFDIIDISHSQLPMYSMILEKTVFRNDSTKLDFSKIGIKNSNWFELCGWFRDTYYYNIYFFDENIFIKLKKEKNILQYGCNGINVFVNFNNSN